MYVSDLAVLPEYRKRGIGTQLLKYALEVATSEGYEFAYMRINDNNPMGYNLSKACGFEKDYRHCQVVSHVHTRMLKDSEEFRIFMSKRL